MAAGRWLLVVMALTAPPAHAQPAPAGPATARARSLAAMNLGVEAYEKQRSFERALTELQRAVDLDATNHLAHYHLGRVHAEQLDWPAAAAAFAAATRMQVDPMYLQWSGVALFRSGRLDEAVPVLEQAVALHRELFRAHHTLALIHLVRGRATAAAERLTRACDLNPKDGQACLELATLYLGWGFLDEAAKVFVQAAMNASAPAIVARSRLGLGIVHDRKGDAVRAIEAFSGALAAAADLHEARFRRGLAHARRGDAPAARADLKAFLAAGVGDTWQLGVAAQTYHGQAASP